MPFLVVVDQEVVKEKIIVKIEEKVKTNKMIKKIIIERMITIIINLDIEIMM